MSLKTLVTLRVTKYLKGKCVCRIELTHNLPT